ncbi:hypothetical protein SEUCBS139899_010550 [Sporothrix eucalyptigena]
MAAVLGLKGQTPGHHVETVAQPSAILDLHFQLSEGRRDVFAVASSTASLSIFRLTAPEANGEAVQLISVIRIEDVGEDVLFLSCVWHPSIPDTIAVTTSTGAVYVMTVDLNQQSAVLPRNATLTHTLETWTAAFSPYTRRIQARADEPVGPNEEKDDRQYDLYTTIYSGGDDSLLQYTSCVLPTHSSKGKDISPPLIPPRACRLTGHNAGVTAILPVSLANLDGGRIVVTGSYDDYIRVYSILDPMDTGGIRRATCLAEQDLGGGVWRLKSVFQATSDGGRRWSMRVLASCMHAGARVIDIDGDVSGSCQISVAARFEEHKSMNYGSDFIQKDTLICISTSFYDKLLCIWEVKDRSGENMEVRDVSSS